VQTGQPSYTARGAAAHRAIHQTLEGGAIFRDPFAASMLDGETLVRLGEIAADPAQRPMRLFIAARSRFSEDTLAACVARGVRQIVVLGAGLDNRAARLPEAAAVRVFEIDHPDMQREKRARLSRARGQNRDSRVFVPVNFERDRLDQCLDRAGFSPALATFWIWEGVTQYLTLAAVEATLRAVSEHSASGSRLALTYTRPSHELGHTVDRAARFLGSLIGEPLHARYGKDEMAALLQGLGFAVLSDEADSDLAARYWKDPPAAHPRSMDLFPEWERLAVAERIRG
jgi:methyltransferase (TIGR00027 family)